MNRYLAWEVHWLIIVVAQLQHIKMYVNISANVSWVWLCSFTLQLQHKLAKGRKVFWTFCWRGDKENAPQSFTHLHSEAFKGHRPAAICVFVGYLHLVRLLLWHFSKPLWRIPHINCTQSLFFAFFFSSFKHLWSRTCRMTKQFTDQWFYSFNSSSLLALWKSISARTYIWKV